MVNIIAPAEKWSDEWAICEHLDNWRRTIILRDPVIDTYSANAPRALSMQLIEERIPETHTCLEVWTGLT